MSNYLHVAISLLLSTWMCVQPAMASIEPQAQYSYVGQRHYLAHGATMPEALTIHRGDTLVVTDKFNKPVGVELPHYVPMARTIDAMPGLVLQALEKGHLRLDAETIQTGSFIAMRAGKAEIVFVSTALGANGGRVKITVQ
jgi:hypothetical protein